MIKINGISTDTIRLMFFPFSVIDKVMFNHDMGPTVETIPSSLLSTVSSFKATNKDCLFLSIWKWLSVWCLGPISGFKCPYHNFQVPQLVQIFYNGLSCNNRAMVDSACGRGIINKLPTDTWKIMGELASNSHQWQSINRHIKKKKPQAVGLFHVDQSTVISSQIEALTRKLRCSWPHKPSKSSRCRFCLLTLHLPNLQWLPLVAYVDQLVTLRKHA